MRGEIIRLGRGGAEGAAPRWACSSDTNESDTNEPPIPYYIFFIKKNILSQPAAGADLGSLSIYKYLNQNVNN